MVDGLHARVGALLWPPRCLLCGEAGASGRDLCPACSAALPWNRSACRRCALPLPLAADACGECLRHPSPLQETHAALLYDFPADRLLPRLKFHGDLACGRLLSQLMAQAFAGLPRPDALIPLPLHRARLRSRGYDQALELARPLARELGLPLLDDVLIRQRTTPPQSRLDADARRRNVRDAFTVKRNAVLPPHVAVIDDVMTTGATLSAAAKALHRAGNVRVDAWICARTP